MAMLLRRAKPTDDEDEAEDDLPDVDERPGWREQLRRWAMRHPRDAVALVAATVATSVIAVNALFLQTGPHPAPLFALRLVTSEPAAPAPAATPRPRPAAEQATRPTTVGLRTPRTRAELVADIQRGLATRGYYDGAVDGIYGPKTDAAVRDFAQVAHFAVGNEPNEALLHSIVTSAVKEVQPAPAASMSRPRHDPIADLLGPSRRLIAVQRALSDFGYGQIKPTGTSSPETVAAIEKFERSRRMPVTGQVSDRLMRELAVVTGRPLE
jgi:peptidoglycan hydrolase-like protein with peptidoglycan-binding domain